MKEIRRLILAELPAFNRSGRFVFRERPIPEDLTGTLRLKLNSDELVTAYSDGRNSLYNFTLYYLVSQQPNIRYNDITDIATTINAVFEDNRTSAYWHYIDSNLVFDEIPVPEGSGEINGFMIEIKAYKGKF